MAPASRFFFREDARGASSESGTSSQLIPIRSRRLAETRSDALRRNAVIDALRRLLGPAKKQTNAAKPYVCRPHEPLMTREPHTTRSVEDGIPTRERGNE